MPSINGTGYEVAGSEDHPVIVLIHGLGLCRKIWDPYVPLFASGYRVLSYDLYGHGDSAAPLEEASLSLYARQIAELLDDVSVDRAALVGFSIGGMINRRFALDYPERLSALAILNSPHDRGEEGQRAVEARAASVRDQGALSTLDAALARWFTPDFREMRPDVMELVKQWRLAADPEGYAQAAWVLANGVTELINPNPAVTAPSLVLTSENDTGSTPGMSRAIASEIPGAELTIIPHYQHLGLMEDTRAFADPVLRFLKRTI